MTSITKETKISLSLALLLVSCTGAVVGSIWRFAGRVDEVTRQTEQVNVKLESMKSEMFTQSQAAEQALRTAMLNPGLRVPDPRNPGQVIVVEATGGSLRIRNPPADAEG